MILASIIVANRSKCFSMASDFKNVADDLAQLKKIDLLDRMNPIQISRIPQK